MEFDTYHSFTRSTSQSAAVTLLLPTYWFTSLQLATTTIDKAECQIT